VGATTVRPGAVELRQVVGQGLARVVVSRPLVGAVQATVERLRASVARQARQALPLSLAAQVSQVRLGLQVRRAAVAWQVAPGN